MMKRLISCVILSFGFVSLVFADDYFDRGSEVNFEPLSTGFYLGVSGGYGMTNWRNLADMIDSNSSGSKAKIKSDAGLAGRILFGYDFNRYFAAEFGYTRFFNKVKFENDSNNEMTNVETQVLDVLGKGKLPLADKVDLYGKFGVDYLMSKFSAGSLYSMTVKKDNGNLALVYGVGIDYKFTSNLILNFEWMRFNGETKFLRENELVYQPYADVLLLGLRYRFDIL